MSKLDDKKKELSVMGEVISDFSKTVNFKGLYNSALEVFGKQAELAFEDDGGFSSGGGGSRRSNIEKLEKLELVKAKSDSLLDAVSNIQKIRHELEIMAESEGSFRRGVELDLLGELLESCRMQARISKKMGDRISARIDELLDVVSGGGGVGVGEEGELSIESAKAELDMLNMALDINIDKTNKIISSSAKLIELERKSGSRPWGARSGAEIQKNTTFNIRALESMNGGAGMSEMERLEIETGIGIGKAKKISGVRVEDLKKLM